MHVKKARKVEALIQMRTKEDEKEGGRVTTVRITRKVEVGTRDRWICFWMAGREVRVGPLSRDQAEKLCEDLGYDAVG